MSPALPRPPAKLPRINIYTLSTGQVLHRNHNGAFAASAFNPGRGQPSRFAPFTAAATSLAVATLYAATSREAAVHETPFHDIKAAEPLKVIRKAIVETRIASTVSPRRDLRLAALFTPDLMLWGITRGQLIDTPKTSYAETALWAQALHAADPTIDGLVWTSRRCDPDLCVVLFGDRLASTDLDVLESLTIAGDDALITELRDFGRRAGITILT